MQQLVTLALAFWAVLTDYRRLHAPALAFLAISTSAILPLLAE